MTPPEDRRQPNVLLVLADQWRGCDQGWNGNVEVLTPHLDALAGAGVAVPHAYANTPVCGPSRASLLTGELPRTHHVVANDLPLRRGLPTMASILAEAGYHTGWIGKWHLDGLPRDKWVPPERRAGFDYWAANNCSHAYFDAHYYEGGTDQPVSFQGYEPDIQTRLAIDFVDAGSQPWFLVVSYGPPHDPYEDVPEEYLSRYDPGRLTPRHNAPRTSEQRALQRQYYSGISAVDDQIGRLRGHLDALGCLDDTVLVVTSDHGDMLGSHGRRAKQVPYEEAVNVPLVVTWPRALTPRTGVPGLLGLVDLPPSLLGLVGVEPPAEWYGRDLSRAWCDGVAARDAVLLGNAVSFDEGARQGVRPWRGFRDAVRTYARHVDGHPWLLFDNEQDPFQEANLVAVGSPRAVKDADELLTELLRDAGDEPVDGPVILRQLGLVAEWNARELELNGLSPRLLGDNGTDEDLNEEP